MRTRPRTASRAGGGRSHYPNIPERQDGAKGVATVDLFDKDLQELVAKGKSQGYLTYDEVNEYLPDEEVNPDKLDNLLIALEEEGIDLVNEPPAPEFYDISEQVEQDEPVAERVGGGRTAARRGRAAAAAAGRRQVDAAIRSACTSRRWPRSRC